MSNEIVFEFLCVDLLTVFVAAELVFEQVVEFFSDSVEEHKLSLSQALMRPYGSEEEVESILAVVIGENILDSDTTFSRGLEVFLYFFVEGKKNRIFKGVSRDLFEEEGV